MINLTSPLQWPRWVPVTKDPVYWAGRTKPPEESVVQISSALSVMGIDSTGAYLHSNAPLDGKMPDDINTSHTPRHSGVSLIFYWEGNNYCLFCDFYKSVADNLEAIYKITDLLLDLPPPLRRFILVGFRVPVGESFTRMTEQQPGFSENRKASQTRSTNGFVFYSDGQGTPVDPDFNSDRFANFMAGFSGPFRNSGPGYENTATEDQEKIARQMAEEAMRQRMRQQAEETKQREEQRRQREEQRRQREQQQYNRYSQGGGFTYANHSNWRSVMGFTDAELLTRKQINHRFRQLSKRYHPDTKGPEASTEKFQRLNEAYQQAKKVLTS